MGLGTPASVSASVGLGPRIRPRDEEAPALEGEGEEEGNTHLARRIHLQHVGGDFCERNDVRPLCRLLRQVAVRFMSEVSGSSAKEKSRCIRVWDRQCW